MFEVRKNRRLRAIPGSPFVSANTHTSCSGDCQSAAYSASRQMLFTAGGLGVSAWTLGADGVLTEVGGSPFGGQATEGASVIDTPTGTFVYATDNENDQVLGFRVETDGALSALPSSPYATGLRPLGTTSAGSDVFVTTRSPTGTYLYAYRAGTDGALAQSPGSPIDVDAGFFQIYAAARGRALCTANCGNRADEVIGFRVDPATGEISVGSKSPVNASANTCGGMAAGIVTAIAFGNSGEAQAFRVRADGRLTKLGGGQSAGFSYMTSSAFTPNQRAVVCCDGYSTVRSFSVNSRGRLRKVSTETITAADVSAMVMAVR